jgi:hypothetical protein
MDTSESQRGLCAVLSILADPQPLPADGISNRLCCRVESRVTHWKQTAAHPSTRHKTRGNNPPTAGKGGRNYWAKPEEVAA